MENNSMGMWQPTTGWYKVIPYAKEARGNLKCLGVQAPLCINDLGSITVIHIKENLPYQHIIELNVNLRNIFGPATLVLALDKDIEFYRIEKCSNKEIKNYQIFGNPVLTEVKDGDSNLDRRERCETEEPRRQIDSRSKSSVRRSGSKSVKKTQRA